MARYESVLDAIGGTPLIRLTRAAEGLRLRVYVKPEWHDPGGSVKDRAALAMLRRAEADGSLRPAGTVVELTSGNTGIGLALAAAHLGYRTVVFTGSATSREKRDQLAAYGAEVRLVDAFVPRGHPDSMRSQGTRFAAETPGALFVDQYDNPADPAAHYATTGPEIWTDTEGAGHFLHPEAMADVWPLALDSAVIDRYVSVEDQDAIDAVRRLIADGLGDDDVVVVAYRRDRRLLAPHPTDHLGWTTPARLRAAPTVADSAQPLAPRLGAALPLTAPAVTAWPPANGHIAPVLTHGRATHTVPWPALHP
ncbi:PLP-dependent cysteine synthase family protein [Streptomyces sp. CBMA29]|uniref:PLP-dependent cysteine synthase family protein n=1 Tax=Streptomyces sp. CBMA29 TaxID=1896314 RepID=UPI0016620602|nr:pyridoxal-phosphate dependent enzyme [Streptomyces sp. CBMA29]MBD0739376.1 hypothetical protein [Streptomyces sp. CBMA29]